MAESINSIITIARRTALAKLSAGDISTIPPITQIALGDAGVDVEGNPIPPAENQETLWHEVCRYDVKPPQYPAASTVRFTITIPRGEQTGAKFSEAALLDSEGVTAAIKSMYVKQKDEDLTFEMSYDLEF